VVSWPHVTFINDSEVGAVTGSWIAVADDSKVTEGVPLAVYPRGVNILLIRVEGAVHAIANKCAHMACPLEGGRLEGHVITCPCHDWSFDVRSGAFTQAAEIRVATYPTRVEDDKIVLNLQAVAS
jgi:nitrite reductase/ring-hydroxylating ferredoxin subunit